MADTLDTAANQPAPTASGPLVGHRGLSHYYPENTRASIDGAITAGLYGVEVDLRSSRDGVPFLVHDVRLKRIAGDPRRVVLDVNAVHGAVAIRESNGGLEFYEPAASVRLEIAAARTTRSGPLR